MESTSIISCDNVHKTYLLGEEGVPALRGVEINVKRGEFVLFYGTSGGGKSTLLNVIGTIDTPTKGNLFLFGTRVTPQTSDSDLAAIRCQRIGFVFQSFNLLSTLDAIGNVSLPMVIAGVLSANEIKQRAVELLEEVGLGHRLHHYPSMLSGGEQQRVAIARALANDPEVLLLDEPTGDLDTKNTMIVIGILLRLNRSHGLSIVMVSHDVYMKQYADRVVHFRDGKVYRTEDVRADVRERSWLMLQTSLGALTEPAEQTMPKESNVRLPSDYSVSAALYPFEVDKDPEIQDIVNKLFQPDL